MYIYIYVYKHLYIRDVFHTRLYMLQLCCLLLLLIALTVASGNVAHAFMRAVFMDESMISTLARASRIVLTMGIFLNSNTVAIYT